VNRIRKKKKVTKGGKKKSWCSFSRYMKEKKEEPLWGREGKKGGKTTTEGESVPPFFLFLPLFLRQRGGGPGFSLKGGGGKRRRMSSPSLSPSPNSQLSGEREKRRTKLLNDLKRGEGKKGKVGEESALLLFVSCERGKGKGDGAIFQEKHEKGEEGEGTVVSFSASVFLRGEERKKRGHSFLQEL